MDRDYWYMMVALIVWAMSGVLLIINYFKGYYAAMGVDVGLMVVAAGLYTVLKKRVDG